MITPESDQAWIDLWLSTVARGEVKMSQRSLGSIERHGGIEHAVAAARSRDIHLLRLTDDRGRVLIAASLDPFETLC